MLVIDDDKSVLRTFGRVLERNGYVVDTAETGREAAEKVSRTFFDVVLADYRLPDMDGTEFVQKARESLGSSVKIMITGLPSVDTGSRALDGGIDAYLVKPVKPVELLAVIEEKLKAKTLP